MSTSSRQLTVLPRPRSHWQAMDAGMLLARAHYLKLLAVWLCFATPVAILSSSLLFFDVSFYLVVFISWWFKPLYELPILMYLSRALFNQPATIRGALKESLSQLGRLFTSYLTLSRLSPSRSMTAPVVFLENQKGKARRLRVSVLSNAVTRAYTLMVAWLNFEGIGVYALAAIVVAFAPHGYSMDDIATMLQQGQSILGPFETIVYGILPMIMAGLVAPLYVSSGFLLYINRRMRLEAWDIEHQFQDLNLKHQKSTASTSIASSALPLALAGSIFAISALAFGPSSQAHAESTRTPPVESVRQTTEAIFNDPAFGFTKEGRRLVYKNDGEDTELNTPDFEPSKISDILDFIILISKYLVYFAAGALVVTVIWGLMRYLPDSWQFTSRFNKRKPTLDLLDVEHHPLTKSLPSDIRTAAESALAQGDFRQASSLLYRGALRTIMRRHGLSIPKSATEQECEDWVEQCNHQEQSSHFKRVVSEWSEIAYAKHHPSHEESNAAIDFWVRHFSFDDHDDGLSEVAK